MAITTLTNLKTSIGLGSRPNLFRVAFSGAPVTFTTTNGNLLCKAAALPGYTIGIVEVPYRGRRIKLPGDRTFAEWTATFLVDSAMNIRRDFEAWMKAVKTNNFNATAIRESSASYFGQIDVYQLNDQGDDIKAVSLTDAFPTDVSQIDLSFDTTDAIEEFTVTFQYQYHS